MLYLIDRSFVDQDSQGNNFQICEFNRQPPYPHPHIYPLSSSNISQMHTHNPFIIHLDIIPHGYLYHSTQHNTQHNTQKVKKNKGNLPRPPPKLNVNRLIKQIANNSDIPPNIAEEHIHDKDAPLAPEEPPKVQPQYHEEEEELDYQVKRQAPLPQSPAQWFDLKEIQAVEIDFFGQFFTGKTYKTPQLYKRYRNFMAEAYRNNSNRYLTFVSLRRVLRGDVICLLKIYQFLVRQGIINYGLSTDGNHQFRDLPLATVTQIGKKPQSCLKRIPQKSQTQETQALDTDNLTVSVINKNFSRTYRVYCLRCKLICGIVWYTFTPPDDQDRNFILCINCYNSMDRQQTLGYVKTDITKKMEGGRDNRKSNWGLDDNIKLLEFMGTCYGQSWNQIEDQFEGKKSIEDILLQFMQFPITNFDPNQHAPRIMHQKLDYPHEEYIQMLADLYDASPYAVKEEDREEERVYEPSPALGNFKTMNSLILSKFNNKLNQLKQIETLWQINNLEIKDRPLVSRTHPSKPSDLEQSSSSSDENSDNE